MLGLQQLTFLLETSWHYVKVGWRMTMWKRHVRHILGIYLLFTSHLTISRNAGGCGGDGSRKYISPLKLQLIEESSEWETSKWMGCVCVCVWKVRCNFVRAAEISQLKVSPQSFEFVLTSASSTLSGYTSLRHTHTHTRSCSLLLLLSIGYVCVWRRNWWANRAQGVWI